MFPQQKIAGEKSFTAVDQSKFYHSFFWARPRRKDVARADLFISLVYRLWFFVLNHLSLAA
jgi:hypothetical protein